ncbi:hypothetical protein GCM10028819_31370 [Spirosoma humi]
MKKLFTLLLFSLLLSSSRLYAQTADPAINIVFQPASISLSTSGAVLVTVLNNGATAINAGCAFVTISVPPIGRIVGLAPGGDPNFTGTVNTDGSSIRIVNTGAALTPLSAASLSVVVQGVAVGGPSDISGNITYDPLQGAACTVAGNLSTQNDNSTTSMTVITNPLPVALVSFTAKAQENRTVAVSWTTSLETNNKGFLVERSKDLKRFERVGEVSELAATSNSLKSYQLIDQMPYAGTSYYRLTQTDLSGKTTVFPVASVVLREEAYGVYPNPVVNDGQFTLRLDEPETATVGFFGADGRPMSFQKTGIQSGNLLLKATGKLSAGIYVLTVEERGQTRQHRIVVQ